MRPSSGKFCLRRDPGGRLQGSEIVPTFCIGATFGCTFAMLTGQPHGLMAACGMLALFVGVTNCPISTLLIGFEMFGYEAMPYFVLSIAVSFTLPDITASIPARSLPTRKSGPSISTERPRRKKKNRRKRT
mgnify:CR=1 FL=1